MTTATPVAALLAAALCCAAEAAAGVAVRLEPVAGSPAPRGVASTVLEVAPERLFRAMTDVAHWAEFMPFMVRSAPDPQTRGAWRQQLDLPFPWSDRLYAVRVDARQDARERWTVSWRHVAGTGNVRGLDGHLSLRAVDEGRAAVELTLWSDLGGLVPAAAQESLLQRSLGWILDGLRQQAGRCRYDTPVAPSCAEERPIGAAGPP